ncbi:MAG TPA: NAD(P)-dependent methylenetetrahydromethanopterin dehydrogenase, partial [Vicinamibacterales bacterium]|nr:NAD(P)-dependent methylenetetrahydromethanopterin dehydrogenase [Vicinamibacterales bacterium]
MRKLLLQLDTSPHPSVFDRVVAYDGGADEVMSYGGVTPEAVRDLVHGAIFTRGPKDLHHTAIFIGGTDMSAGERILNAVRKAFFGPFTVSVMLDSNGSNTTAVAAVAKLLQTAGSGGRGVVTAGTGPVGLRAAGLLAKAGVDVAFTSRRAIDPAIVSGLQQRFGGRVAHVVMADSAGASPVLEGATMLLNTGPAGV